MYTSCRAQSRQAAEEAAVQNSGDDDTTCIGKKQQNLQETLANINCSANPNRKSWQWAKQKCVDITPPHPRRMDQKLKSSNRFESYNALPSALILRPRAPIPNPKPNPSLLSQKPCTPTPNPNNLRPLNLEV